MADNTIPMDRLAKVYRKIRAAMKELTDKYEAEFAVLSEQRNQVANAMKDQMLALGTKSIRTDEGTIVLSTKTRYDTSDWDSFKEFVLTNQALELLERRIAQTNMSKFLEENPGVVPPGLNSNSEYVVSVRKPN
jgi:hypothetical protein